MSFAERRGCDRASVSNSSQRLTPVTSFFLPPYVPHQEINASTNQPLKCVLVRSDQERVVVTFDIEPAEAVAEVLWVDPNHPS